MKKWGKAPTQIVAKSRVFDYAKRRGLAGYRNFAGNSAECVEGGPPLRYVAGRGCAYMRVRQALFGARHPKILGGK
jgi:hypothetical protein